ncbi:MAG: F0F1 ATP synthase subunit delta [Actinomycetes bacterium]|jgi:F-type H+-transporting ATPase subunit delta
MLGASRESLAACQEGIDARRHDAMFARLPEDLFAVASLLDGQRQLLAALADSGQPSSFRDGLVRDVFATRVSELAMDVVLLVVSRRWSSESDMVLALELLADQAAFTVAQNDSSLDATEEELFRFGRALDASSDLQMALTDPAQSATVKSNIVRDLLAGRGTVATSQVLQYAVGHLHGRRIDSVIETLCALAAQQRQRMVAEVRVAAPLDDAQRTRLQSLLSRLKGREVRLNVAVDPSVLGGVHVQIGDEVIDGTVASRMEQARRALLG